MPKKSEDKARCVLTLPLITEPWQEHIIEKRFRIMEQLENSLIAYELKKLRKLENSPEYKMLIQQIQETPKEKRKALYRQKSKMLANAGFSEFAFKDAMKVRQKHFVKHIASHVSHKAASDIWRSFEKYLFHGAKKIHFKKRGTLQSIASQDVSSGMKLDINTMSFKWDGGRRPKEDSKKLNPKTKEKKIRIKVRYPENDYERQMLQKPVKYYRIVRQWMKTRYKYYLQITLVGDPIPKRERLHAEGRVGLDIGPQTLAVVSEKSARLHYLSEHVIRNHQKIQSIQRKMDRSRRAMNPEHFNEDGTIKRVRIPWKDSKHYLKLKARLHEFQRRNAAIRKHEHYCLVNELLTLGSEFFVEKMEWKGMQKRSQKTVTDKNGKIRSKKRFGKSLANNAPAALITILQTKSGGHVHVVNTKAFRASQYDHMSGEYHKKTLRQREHILPNGDHIQRDLYSAFLLMNSNKNLTGVQPAYCELFYPDFKKHHDQEIQRIRENIRQGKRYPISFGVA